MTIDERIDALTARHEALTFNVEVMSGMMKDLLTVHAQNEIRYKILASVVEQHTTRLDNLEGGV